MKKITLFFVSMLVLSTITLACHVEIKGDSCWANGTTDTLRARLFEPGDWDDNVTYNWEASTDNLNWYSLGVHTKRYVITSLSTPYLFYRVSAKENTPGLQAYCNDYFCNLPYTSDAFRVWNCTVLASALWSNTSVRIDGNTAHLSWKFTGDETVSTFRVERSFNGQQFMFLSPVLPAVDAQYEMPDNIGSSEDVYYRITAVTISGTSYTSSVLHGSRTKTWSVSVYPNPFTEGFTIKDLSSSASVLVYDAQGQQIGYHRVGNQIRLRDAKPATYFVKIIDNKNFVFTARVSKL